MAAVPTSAGRVSGREVNCMPDGESTPDFDSRPEAIRRTIEARIIDGKMQPGDRLGLKADLQKEFDVAGPTIAQALTLLTNDGLISMRRGPGRRHLRVLGGQQFALGTFLLDAFAELGVSGEQLAHMHLKHPQRLAPRRRCQPARDRRRLAHGADVLVQARPRCLHDIIDVRSAEPVRTSDAAEHAIEALDQLSPGRVVAAADGCHELDELVLGP